MTAGHDVLQPYDPTYVSSERAVPYTHILGRIAYSIQVGNPIDYWDPARVVNGLIDFNIDHPEQIEDKPTLVDSAMDAALAMHRGNVAPSALAELLEVAEAVPKLARYPYQYNPDDATVGFSNPEYCTAAAEMLREVTGGQDALFIALARGGTTASINTYIDFIEGSEADGSRIYPVRFSTDKLSDSKPRHSLEEEAYLVKIARQMPNVVVFDEDSCTGTTIRGAMTYFDELLGCQTIPAVSRGIPSRDIMPDETLVGREAFKKSFLVFDSDIA